jgi:hypothetical protein
MKNRKVKDESDNRTRKTIRRNGYEYSLVSPNNRELTRIPSPCFMGESGFALESCHKLQKV